MNRLIPALTVAALAFVLTACAPSEDAQLNDCMVSVATVYVSEYGPLDADTWDSLRADCTDQIERGEWK